MYKGEQYNETVIANLQEHNDIVADMIDSI